MTSERDEATGRAAGEAEDGMGEDGTASDERIGRPAAPDAGGADPAPWWSPGTAQGRLEQPLRRRPGDGHGPGAHRPGSTWLRGDITTEDLRTALQQYRAFCGRLEGLA